MIIHQSTRLLLRHLFQQFLSPLAALLLTTLSLQLPPLELSFQSTLARFELGQLT
jgi:hypothetical protein